MSNDADEWLDGWRRIRERGILRFVLLRGLVAFGLAFTAVTYLLDTFVWGKPWDPTKLIFAVLIGGSTFGTLMWFWGERRYRKLVRDHA